MTPWIPRILAYYPPPSPPTPKFRGFCGFCRCMVRKLYQYLHQPHHHHHVILRGKAKRQNPRPKQYAMVWRE